MAQYERYTLVYTLLSESGQQFEMPGIPYDEYFDCNRAKKRVKIGDEISRGVIISADGISRSATIQGARCVGSIRKQ